MMMMMENEWKKNIPVIVKPCKNVSLSFPVVMGYFVPSETLTLACTHTHTGYNIKILVEARAPMSCLRPMGFKHTNDKP